jgi:hypothetical protein
MAGYSSRLIKEIQQAPQDLLGVRLGRVCVEQDIPVVDVAEFLGCTRMSVYAWFRGNVKISDKYAAKVQALIEFIERVG